MGREGEKRAEAAVVVVHYRSPGPALACLENLQAHAGGTPVFLVENGSGDGSLEALRAGTGEMEDVRILASEKNLGFGGGCNLGVEKALESLPGLEYVLFLNPDTIVEEGFLEELLAAARRRKAGVTGGLVLSMDGREVLFENGRVRPFTLSRCHAPAPPGKEEYETEFVTGACMLVDAKLLRAGLRFDEKYFLYVEDLDFCRQVRSMGRSLWVTRRARVRHAGGGSQGGEREVLGGMREGEFYYLARNKVYFARKWLRPAEKAAFLFSAFVLKPLAGMVAYGKVGFLPGYYKALAEGLHM